MRFEEFKKEIEATKPKDRIEDPCAVKYNGVERRGEERKPCGQVREMKIVPSSYNRVGWAFVADPNGFVSYQRIGRDYHMGAVELC